ncbi:hypothetical protein [Aquipseudomonas alcaligenes]|uniref:hypothetical protein n=1 Tax=Aquipseudomonas alcaligenes TaxID=43263 RepID=UPI0036547DAD
MANSIKSWKLGFLMFLLDWAVSTWFGLLYQNRYCGEWDAALSALLDKHADKIEVGEHTTTINGVEIWTSNRFYAYGHIYDSSMPWRRPGLWNMYRLWCLTRAKHRQREQDRQDAYVRRLKDLAVRNG